MLKISMLALCTVITSLLIKKQSPVTASVIGVSLCLIISINIINNISAITGQLGVMISLTGIGDVYIKIIMKIIDIFSNCYSFYISNNFCIVVNSSNMYGSIQ